MTSTQACRIAPSSPHVIISGTSHARQAMGKLMPVHHRPNGGKEHSDIVTSQNERRSGSPDDAVFFFFDNDRRNPRPSTGRAPRGGFSSMGLGEHVRYRTAQLCDELVKSHRSGSGCQGRGIRRPPVQARQIHYLACRIESPNPGHQGAREYAFGQRRGESVLRWFWEQYMRPGLLAMQNCPRAIRRPDPGCGGQIGQH